MSAAASPFCAHKRLRTSCPECKPPPPAPRAPEPKAAPKKREADDADEAKVPRATGIGKPLLPSRPKRSAKPATMREAEQAEAWWAKKKQP